MTTHVECFIDNYDIKFREAFWFAEVLETKYSVMIRQTYRRGNLHMSMEVTNVSNNPVGEDGPICENPGGPLFLPKFVTWQKIFDFCQVCWSVASVCLSVCLRSCTYSYGSILLKIHIHVPLGNMWK